MESINMTDAKTMIQNGEGKVYYEEWAHNGIYP